MYKRQTHTLDGFMKHLVAALQRAAASRKMIAAARQMMQMAAAAPARAAAAPPREPARSGKTSLIAIGASTGGVPAVQTVMRDLAHLRLPIVVVQHLSLIHI